MGGCISGLRGDMGRPIEGLVLLGSEISHGQIGQKLEDAIVHTAQRVADIATILVFAIVPIFGETGCQEYWPINGTDDVEGGDIFRITRETVAAIGAMLRRQETATSELLQDF